MWLLAKMDASWLFVLGLVLLTFVLLKRAHRYYYGGKSERRPKPLGRVSPSRHRPLADAPPDIVRWQVEMHETARDLKAELDSKLGSLQALICLAQQETQRLEEAIARSEQLASQTDGAASRAAASPAEFDPPSFSSAASPGNLPGTAARRRAIYALADRGRSAASIADQIGAPVGEVELILSLRSPSE